VYARRLAPLGKNERWKTVRGGFMGSPPPEFFDPLGLGICFGAEFRRGDPWETIVPNYLGWRDKFQITNMPEGKVQFEGHDFSMVIDTQRGHWPISMSSARSKTEINIMTELKLANVNDNWVPTEGTVFLPDETTELSFKWHSVNQDIPAERFTPADAKSRYGVSVSEYPAVIQ
jgi:hypothetical protein